MDKQTVRIIRQVLQGRREAFSDLIVLYQNDVWKVLSAGPFNRTGMEDVCQDVFIAAYKSLDSFDLDADFSRWIKGIARNHLKMVFRSLSTEKRHMQLYRQCLEERIAAEEHNPQVDVRVDRLQQCKGQMSEDVQNLLDMHYQEGLSLKHISEVRGKTLSAIKVMLHRVRNKLKECIESGMGTA